MTPIDPEIPELELRTYAKNQPPYIPLPTRAAEDGTVVTCWQMTWRERLSVLLSGKLFLTLLTFNRPLQPVRLGVTKPEVETYAHSA